MAVKSVIYSINKTAGSKTSFFAEERPLSSEKNRKKIFLLPKHYVDLVKGGKKIYTWAPPDNTFKKGDFSLNLSQIYKSIVLI